MVISARLTRIALMQQKLLTSKQVVTFNRIMSSNSHSPLPEDAATIIQGPSLLINTSKFRPSPSMFFLPGLRSLPFWTAPSTNSANKPSKVSIAYGDPTITNVVNHLETHYKTIKDEYMQVVMGMGENTDLNSNDVSKPLQPDYDVNMKGEHAADKLHQGTWDWHSYLLNGTIQPKFEKSCPKTTSLIQELQSSLFLNNPFGFTFFSTLHGKSYIKPHYGPMNLRLRIHLPLIVPSDTKPDAFSSKPQTKCGIRVGDQIRSWEEGKAIVLDDSYEHEVWNETKEVRVVLLLDVWHPDVTFEERNRIGNMFQFAQKQGWMKK